MRACVQACAHAEAPLGVMQRLSLQTDWRAFSRPCRFASGLGYVAVFTSLCNQRLRREQSSATLPSSSSTTLSATRRTTLACKGSARRRPAIPSRPRSRAVRTSHRSSFSWATCPSLLVYVINIIFNARCASVHIHLQHLSLSLQQCLMWFGHPTRYSVLTMHARKSPIGGVRFAS